MLLNLFFCPSIPEGYNIRSVTVAPLYQGSSTVGQWTDISALPIMLKTTDLNCPHINVYLSLQHTM